MRILTAFGIEGAKMDVEKHLEDAILPNHHPASRLRGPLPEVPYVSTVKVTARGDDCCYDSGVGEIKYTHHTVPFYEGLNTLGTMETDVDGEVAYSVSVNNYSPSKLAPPSAGAAKMGEKPRGSCISAACVAILTSAIALLLVLAVIACGLLIYFGVLPLDTFVTTEQARQLQANISAWNSQSDQTARQLDRLTAELAALQATTAQLRTTLASLRAAPMNGTNGTATNNTAVTTPAKSYPATLVNLTLFQDCKTTTIRTCNIVQGSSPPFCSTSGYTLSSNGLVTVDVFCATAITTETNAVVASLDVIANSALCYCSVVSGTATASTACYLHVTECPAIDSFATVVQT